MLVAMTLVLSGLLTLMVLVVDWGRVVSARSELQATVDSAARFGAANIDNSAATARQQALVALQDNRVNGVTLPATAKIVVQTGIWDEITETFVEVPDGTPGINAVRTRVTLAGEDGVDLQSTKCGTTTTPAKASGSRRWARAISRRR